MTHEPSTIASLVRHIEYLTDRLKHAENPPRLVMVDESGLGHHAQAPNREGCFEALSRVLKAEIETLKAKPDPRDGEIAVLEARLDAAARSYSKAFGDCHRLTEDVDRLQRELTEAKAYHDRIMLERDESFKEIDKEWAAKDKRWQNRAEECNVIIGRLRDDLKKTCEEREVLKRKLAILTGQPGDRVTITKESNHLTPWESAILDQYAESQKPA